LNFYYLAYELIKNPKFPIKTIEKQKNRFYHEFSEDVIFV
jgi:hypothetical protein